MSGDDEKGRPALTREDRLAVSLGRGQELLRAGQAEAASAELEEALSLARELDDSRSEASCLGLLCQACLRLGRRDEAERHGRAGLRIAEVLRDAEAARHLEGLVATCRAGDEAIELSTTFGDGRAALEEGDAARAAPLLEKALHLAREAGHAAAEAASTHLLARAKLELGEREEAARLAAEALDLARKAGDDRAAAVCEELVALVASGAACPIPDLTAGSLAAELHEGQTALATGEIARGIEVLERVRVRACGEGQKVPEAAASGLLAQAYIEQERFEEAAARAIEAAAIAEGLGEPEAAAEFRMLADMAGASREAHDLARAIHKGATALEKGRPGDAIAPLQTGIGLAEGQGNEVAEALARGVMTRALLALGRRAEAKAHASRCLAIARSRGESESVAHFEALCASIEDEAVN